MNLINIKKRRSFYYVQNDDCYIFYYLFKYKFKNKKCYFRKKQINKIIHTLVLFNISFKVKDYACMCVYKDEQYENYVKLGQEKLVFDKALANIENRLLMNIENKNFNQIYRKVMCIINE